MMTASPTTRVWFRNPRNYMREVINAGAMHIAWDIGTLIKYRIDPEQFANLYYGAGQEWRGLVIANEGAMEIRAGRGMNDPIANYPVWSFEEDISILEHLIANPVAEDLEIVNDPLLPKNRRPRPDQDHVVVIIDLPNASSNITRKFLRSLKELQEEWPDCIIHIHGMYAWKALFGLGFKSIDWEGRSDSANGIVILPTGKQIKEDKAILHSQWITLLGMKAVELKAPELRCTYNIRAAMWAGENYLRAVRFRTTGRDNPDITSPSASMEIQQVKAYAAGLPTKPGDKFFCDTCSLADKCKYYREGSVCTLPTSETNDLARMFGSRDADQIIDALGVLVRTNTRRLEEGIKQEEEDGLDPKVGRLLDEIFAQGTKLAKLVDPARFSPGKVQVNVQGGQTQIITSSPSELVATVVRQLEDQGFSRHEITQDMIGAALENLANPPKQLESVVEGEVVD